MNEEAYAAALQRDAKACNARLAAVLGQSTKSFSRITKESREAMSKAGIARAAQMKATIRQGVIAYLHGCPGATSVEIAQAVKTSRSILRSVMHGLLTDKQVRRAGASNKFRWWLT